MRQPDVMQRVKSKWFIVTTSPIGNRINAKIDTALVPDWKNTREFEAVIEVPKGHILNIGRVEKQYTKTGAILKGDADKILLPQGWPSEWIKDIRKVPSKQEDFMNKKEKLTRQVKTVINILENEYPNEIKKDIFQLIYKRYKNALEILKNNKDFNRINIVGGVRAYIDSYNDYQNPLLKELHKAENLLKELL